TEADNLAAGTQTAVSVAENATTSAVLATFTDSGYPNNAASDFTATIDWGTGPNTTGTVNVSGSTITVTDTTGHTYADEGSYTITVTLTDTDDDLSRQATPTSPTRRSTALTEADNLAAGTQTAVSVAEN